jgi:hypothetical protein
MPAHYGIIEHLRIQVFKYKKGKINLLTIG